MKKKLEKIRNKKKEIIKITFIVIVFVLFFAGFSLGKGFSNTKVDSKVEIAKPIVVVENDPILDITTKNNMGNYYFKVKNYNGSEEITQVKMKYNIELLTNLAEAIEVKMYKEGKEIPIENNTTQEFIFNKNEKEEHNYRLELKYDKNKASSIEEIIQDLQIKVHSEQART